MMMTTKRMAGAWLVFVLIAVPRLVGVTVRVTNDPSVLSERVGHLVRVGFRNRQDIPQENVLPPPKSVSVSDKLPSRFFCQPLVFFSTAPPESLALLPGIGPVLAARICDARGGKRLFSDWDDLLRVKGIGGKTVSRFKRLADSK